MSQLGGIGATPARRSARISQAGSVTNQSVLTTVTTGGTRQRKKGPLTKVKSRKSNAYGASGRVGAAEELSLSATNFAQAFQTQRGAAFARDDEDETDGNDVDELGSETPSMSGGLRGRRGSSSSGPEDLTPVAPGLSFEDSDDDMTPNGNGLTASIGNTSKSFGLGHEAGMLFQPPRRQTSRGSSEESYGRPLWQRNRERRLRTQVNAQQTETHVESISTQARTQATPAKRAAIEQSVDELVAEEQARLQREGPPQVRSQTRRQNAQPRPSNPQAVNDWLGNVAKGHDHDWTSWKQYLMPLFWVALGLAALLLLARSLISDPYPESTPRAGLTTAVNARISRTWYDVADWVMPAVRDDKQPKEEIASPFNSNELDHDDYLGDQIRRIYKDLDGRIRPMGDTITQLKEDLPNYMIVRRRPDGTRELTDDFWNALMSKANSPSGNEDWIEYLKSNEAKLRDLFGIPMLNDPSDPRPEAISRAEFVRTIEQHYQSTSAQVDKKIVDAIQGLSTSIKTAAQAEAKQATIDSIRLHALAQSNLLANYELNLRKANYFSPGLGATIDPGLTSATFLNEPRPLAKYVHWLALVPHRNPPQAALAKWEEPGDCWCAAPNPALNGQAQLTVALSRPMFPLQVTIEHVPMSMMPDKKITNAPRHVELWVESDYSAQYQYSHRSGVCQNGPVGWKCLGSFTYNIHGSNHQQTFDLDAQSSVPVNKVMLRVMSNWGADHTCMYRARLHGRDAVEDYQYDTRLNDPLE
jgi:SUN domain-containing protein 1/2